MTFENAMGLAFLRLVIGGALLLLIVRPPVTKFTKVEWQDSIVLGLAYAFFNVTAYKALTQLPLGLVAAIGFLGPLCVSLLGARGKLEFLWPLVGFAGVLMLTPLKGNADSDWSSLLYGSAYAVSWGAYILASARAGRSMRGLDGFVVATVIAAVLLLPISYSQIAPFVATPDILYTTVFVAVSVTVAFSLEYFALKSMEPRVFGVLLSLEPAIASVIGVMLLHEILSMNSWVAIALVTAASIGATLMRRKS
jgi:inner membrane transporter RhtA